VSVWKDMLWSSDQKYTVPAAAHFADW
jgi:hypothetical protein